MMELAITIDYSTQWASRIGFDGEFGQGTRSYVGIARVRCARVAPISASEQGIVVSVVRHVLHYGFASRLSVHAGNSVFLSL
jgi:hypothetical protein